MLKKGPEPLTAPDPNEIFNILPYGILSQQRYKTFSFPANYLYLWSGVWRAANLKPCLMKILIDNGHGFDTPGKRSPDGRLMEWAYNREIAARVSAELQRRGYFSSLLVPEPDDIPLEERCLRVNHICAALGRRNVCLVSIHVNAAGRGDRWYEVEGWCCFTVPDQTQGDKLADCLCAAAKEVLAGHKMRFDYTDGDPDQEKRFYILRKTACASCLTENGFMDGKASCDFLLSDEGKAAIVDLHVRGIEEYVRLYDEA